MKKWIAGLIVVAFFASGCAEATKTQKGAGWGAAIGTLAGAGIGAAVGGKKGALIGAGTGLVVGGLAGGAIGRYMDNQERDLRNAMGQVESASIRRDQDILELTFKADMMFDTNSSVLKPGAYGEIDRVCSVLNKYPQCRIRIEGHTDSQGDENYNQQLSMRRAEAVKNALVSRNVDPARLETIGMGEGMPIAGNDTEGGRQMNRRVTMKIIPIEAQGQG
jgi:outer membrane protein OmpA-like peptidoglycan-associated protein